MAFPETHPALDRALAERGYADPTPVQAAVLQPEARDRDLLVSAQTGSGKTVAFGLAMASTLLGDRASFEPAAEPRALIIAPTRELALQVHRELTWLYDPAGARVVSCVGGMDVRREQRALEQGAHIVVGTPGRLRDHLERSRLDPSGLRVVVLDEADEMLDLGFREDLEFILDAAPAERRTLLFSATIAREIATLARRFQRDAVRIDTLVRDQPHGDIDYRAVHIAPNEIEHGVVNLLRYFEARGALVFCHTREAVRHLHGSLLERGFAAVALSGELTQSERSHALQSLRDGRSRVCVATDVAARGIDLPDLGLVIHADLPSDRETLLHRSGRTGRAGRKGVCVLLVPYTRRRRAESLIAAARIEASWAGPPSVEEIRRRDQERLLQDPIFVEPSDEEDTAAARALLAQRSPEELAAALARLYRSRLPEPEEVFAEPRSGGPREHREGRERRQDRETGRRDGPAGDDMVWFRINVGRANNADPRWLLPTICRLGHVTRREVGTIRIFDRETKFEVARHAAPKFAGAVRKSADESLRIEPADFDKTGSAARERPGRGGKPKSAGPHRAPGPSRSPGKGPGKPRGGKPGRTR